MTEAAKSTIDQSEVDRLSHGRRGGGSPTGEFKPLHKFNPFASPISGTRRPRTSAAIRLLGPASGRPAGARYRLRRRPALSEPVARMGATVISAGQPKKNIGIASTREASGVPVDYRAVTAEQLAEAGEDLRHRLEQHGSGGTRRRRRFLHDHLRENGPPRRPMFVATISRTMKAAALAIFAAENVLRWLPRGTANTKSWCAEEIEKPVAAGRPHHHRPHRRILQSAVQPVEPVARHGRELRMLLGREAGTRRHSTRLSRS